MINKTDFFIAFLISVLLVGPAFSDEPATQNWVKTWVPSWAENRGANYFIPANKESDLFTKRRGEVLSTGTAHQMRDLLYRHKSDSLYAPDSSMVKEGYELRTTGQTAFEGINEVLEKVNGNDGTENSAVQLETTAQNAYGAINELKDEIAGLQDQVDTKVSSDGLSETVTVVVEEQIGGDLDTVYDVVTGERKSVAIVDVFTEKDFEEIRK